MVMSHPLFLIHHKSRISHGQLPSPIVSPTWLLLVGRGNVQLPLSFVFFGKKNKKGKPLVWGGAPLLVVLFTSKSAPHLTPLF
jgi:hypothetical protein